MNKEFRGIDKPTDVLSFPMDDDITLGDIAVSIETATRQAAEADWPVASELALLAVHGFLHLTGHDDEELSDAREMETVTRAILTNAGVVMPPGDHPFFRSFLEED